MDKNKRIEKYPASFLKKEKIAHSKSKKNWLDVIPESPLGKEGEKKWLKVEKDNKRKVDEMRNELLRKNMFQPIVKPSPLPSKTTNKINHKFKKNK